MQSTNFEFLRTRWPELADLGGFAESYAATDPQSACVKSRLLTEHIAMLACHRLHLPVEGSSFLSMLRDLEDTRTIPRTVLDRFHQVRIAGNDAAHNIKNAGSQAFTTVEATFDIARWWAGAVLGSFETIPKTFQKPPVVVTPNPEEAATKITELEEKAAALAAENEALRRKEATLSAELREKQQQDARNSFQYVSQMSSDALRYNEAETRKRLIDTMLVAAGWDVDNPDQVQFEVELTGQGTESGKGRADYVLYDDDGTALAVIEAKRTSINPKDGRRQAQDYADALEKLNPHQLRPLIMLCNGYKTIMCDDRGGPASLGVKGYADRQIYGFPSKDSLSYRVKFQRMKMLDPVNVAHNAEIANRPYQVEAIKAVCERFGEQRRRKALIVQATGTGKTRVAIAIVDVLIRAGFAKRILFLCDRLELQRQAKNNFTTFLPDRTVSNFTGAVDATAQIVLSTYQSMVKRFQQFDVAWFDLVIADESHRSIYNKYRDLFLYFDALQIGLTATPRHKVSHNTYGMFDCKNGDPTYYYEFDRAIDEGYLVDFKSIAVTTKFLREGINADNMSEEDRQILEEQGFDLDNFEIDADRLDKQAYNKDTNRKILQNLMENGLRDATENGPGKSIIFARNHRHAQLLGELFQEMYPEFGPDYCVVIDNYSNRADQLIDDFKTHPHNPVIAVSVDMLDTGIDVPEVLNLVFAKPIKSYVKYWQMIGRGTRLCKDLLGNGKDKECFYIFDHWGNYEFFGGGGGIDEPEPSLSLLERLFASRIDLADTALSKYDSATQEHTISLIRGMIVALPDDSLPVKEKYEHKLSVLSGKTLEQFEPATISILQTHILPLMRFVSIRDERDAYVFDLLITDLQQALLEENLPRIESLRASLENSLAGLRNNLDVVKAKFPQIKELLDKAFWDNPLDILLPALEQKRVELRGIMQFSVVTPPPPGQTIVIDVKDGDIKRTTHARPKPSKQEMQAYRVRVRAILEPFFQIDHVLQKIRRGQGLTPDDFAHLTKIIIAGDASIDISILTDFYPATQQLNEELLAIVGMDAETVKAHFAEFYQKYPLTSLQIAFLNLLQKHIQQNGPIKFQQLYEDPFKKISTSGPDGVFSTPAIADLAGILNSFVPHAKRA